MSRQVQEKVEAELAMLAGLDAAALRERWAALYGCPAPRLMRRDLLLRGVAYRIQEQAHGGLKPAVLRRLRALVGENPTEAAGPALRPGVQLLREWNGETHRVEVLADGFLWQGVRHNSLSAVAYAITGTRWSGPRFFGLLGKDRP